MSLAMGAASAWGQEYKDYDLSKYRLPDITRNELDFSLNTAGEFHDYKKSDGLDSHVNGDFDAVFNRYRNTRTFRGTQKASFDFSGEYEKNLEDEKNRSYTLGLSYDNSSRFYGDDYDGLFFETGGQVSFLITGLKSSGIDAYQVSWEDVKTTSKSIRLSIPLRVGKGRIERVEDARQAIYILENLSKRKVMNRKLTDEEIYEFAQLISTVKNKRFFDARLRLIDEVTAVDSFLVKSGALASNGASYFTTLYDYWMYGDLFERKSGMEISGGITPGFGFDDYDKKIEYERYDWDSHANSRYLRPSIMGNVRLEYEKPMNLYWQNSALVEAYGGYEYQYSEEESGAGSETKENRYNANLTAKYAFGYYPNSRTNINFGVQEDLGWRKFSYKDSDRDGDSFGDTNTSVFLNLYYYFSPQLRLAAEGRLSYYYSGRENMDFARWYGNLAFTLTYSLF